MFTEYRIPKAFYDDHLSRDCSVNRVIEETDKHYIINVTDEECAELLSDADYYSNAVKMMGTDYLGLQASARATAKALRKGGYLNSGGTSAPVGDGLDSLRELLP